MFRRLRYVILVSVLLLYGGVWGVYTWVEHSTDAQLYADIAKIPKNKVGLLLGTAKYNDRGRNIVNLYYQHRIEAAVALYMAGKIDYIIVSGDNGTMYYNEPLLMKNDLMARGVPEGRIVMDNAGFRTLDSILRCKLIFGQQTFTIISQKFHNERAVYIANSKQLDVVAFNAEDGDMFWAAAVRERLARVKMLLDLLVNKQAKYYGAQIEIK